jgi:hypothetical protein
MQTFQTDKKDTQTPQFENTFEVNEGNTMTQVTKFYFKYLSWLLQNWEETADD